MKDCKHCKFFCEELYKEVLEISEENKTSASTGCCFQQEVNLESNKEECFFFIKRPKEWAIDTSVFALAKKKNKSSSKKEVENKEKDDDNRTIKRSNSSNRVKQNDEKSGKRVVKKAPSKKKALKNQK